MSGRAKHARVRATTKNKQPRIYFQPNPIIIIVVVVVVVVVIVIAALFHSIAFVVQLVEYASCFTIMVDDRVERN